MKDKNDTINNETTENDSLSFSKKLGNVFEKTKAKVGTFVKDGFEKVKGKASDIKNKIEDSNDAKKLEKAIEIKFNSEAISYKVIVPDEKIKMISVYAKTDYSNKQLTLIGEVTGLTNSYFVDSQNQKFVVKLIRQNQTTNITIDNVEYTRKATIIDFELYSDNETKKQVQQIVYDNSIHITDSKINKADIGNNK